jgi:hypothetical protein
MPSDLPCLVLLSEALDVTSGPGISVGHEPMAPRQSSYGVEEYSCHDSGLTP